MEITDKHIKSQIQMTYVLTKNPSDQIFLPIQNMFNTFESTQS